ncbi:MAG: hypothetical protein U5R30_09580 [Deltaproteobacteria bacterium]|nr:hypothetical protein [Deltaproteobacteria bacterium]
MIRLVKRAFQKQGISMPDEAREVVFPQGVPITVIDGKPTDVQGAVSGERLSAQSRHEERDAASTKAEAGLYSEAVVIEGQAKQAQLFRDRENHLPVACGKQTEEPDP